MYIYSANQKRQIFLKLLINRWRYYSHNLFASIFKFAHNWLFQKYHDKWLPVKKLSGACCRPVGDFGTTQFKISNLIGGRLLDQMITVYHDVVSNNIDHKQTENSIKITILLRAHLIRIIIILPNYFSHLAISFNTNFYCSR